MHFKIYLYAICYVVFVADNIHAGEQIHFAKIKDDRRSKISSSNTSPPKILPRSLGSDQIFSVRVSSDGGNSLKCQCVAFYQCDTQDVYKPLPNESYVTCGRNEACCLKLFNSQSPLVSSNSSPLNDSPATGINSTDVCVDYKQCDELALVSHYGLSALIPRNTFSNCPIGQLLCPLDKVISNSSTVNVSTTPDPFADCSCAPTSYCNAEFGEGVINSRMGRCEKGEICCPNDLILPIINATIPTFPNFECGIQNDAIDTRVIGGSETKFGEFPWMVLILERVNNEEKILCGASLISPKLILTAAHCLFNKKVDSLIIRAGEYDLHLPSESEKVPHQDRSISNITIHPNYIDKLLIHDVALIVVDTAFTFASNVVPICLPLIKSPYSPTDTSIYDVDHCIATGWGAKVNFNPTTPKILNKIYVKLTPSDQCLTILRKSVLGPKFILHPSLICATGLPNADTCKGDGGGPLFCPLKIYPNRYVQVGIIAGGLNCSEPYPSLYASLLHSNAEWITDEIAFKNIFE